MNEPIHSIFYPFRMDEGLGSLGEERDYARHVEQMMKQILFTNPGERINRPDFGCGIRRMVFAPNSDVTASLTKVIITQSLEKWIGNLIEVIDVTTLANDEKLEIKIIYLIKAREERRYLNVELTL